MSSAQNPTIDKPTPLAINERVLERNDPIFSATASMVKAITPLFCY